MADVKITLNTPIYDGMPITFKAPCDCTEVAGIQVQHLTETGKTQTTAFDIKDAHGVSVSGLGNLFMQGAYVRAILDTRTYAAYIQNADTNSYVEKKLLPTLSANEAGRVLMVSAQGAAVWAAVADAEEVAC